MYGHDSKCKSCTKKLVRARRVRELEKVREYDRARGSLPHRVKARQDYSKTEAYRVSAKASKKKYKENNKEKIAARGKVCRAVMAGKIEKSKCIVCGCGKTQAHHEDYAKPLDIVWLCVCCHADRHKDIRSEKRRVNHGKS